MWCYDVLWAAMIVPCKVNCNQQSQSGPLDLLQDEPRMAVLEWLGVLPQALFVTRSIGQKIHGNATNAHKCHIESKLKCFKNAEVERKGNHYHCRASRQAGSTSSRRVGSTEVSARTLNCFESAVHFGIQNKWNSLRFNFWPQYGNHVIDCLNQQEPGAFERSMKNLLLLQAVWLKCKSKTMPITTWKLGKKLENVGRRFMHGFRAFQQVEWHWMLLHCAVLRFSRHIIT